MGTLDAVVIPRRRALTPSRRWLRYSLPAALLAVLLAGGALAALETDTVGSYADGVWWALSLVSTVGFVGGIPHTAGGKVLSAGLMILGFLLLAMTTAAVASLFVHEEEEPRAEREQGFERTVLAELGDLRERLARLEGTEPRAGRGSEDPAGR